MPRIEIEIKENEELTIEKLEEILHEQQIRNLIS